MDKQNSNLNHEQNCNSRWNRTAIRNENSNANQQFESWNRFEIRISGRSAFRNGILDAFQHFEVYIWIADLNPDLG